MHDPVEHDRRKAHAEQVSEGKHWGPNPDANPLYLTGHGISSWRTFFVLLAVIVAAVSARAVGLI